MRVGAGMGNGGIRGVNGAPGLRAIWRVWAVAANAVERMTVSGRQTNEGGTIASLMVPPCQEIHRELPMVGEG